MPKSLISDEELRSIISNILMDDGRNAIAEILHGCNESPHDYPPPSWQEHFHLDLAYDGYNMRFHRFACSGDSVMEAHIQFMRPAKHSPIFLSRNRGLVKKIVRIIKEEYDKVYGVGRQPNKVKNPNKSDQEYLVVKYDFPYFYSECAVYDEPYSSGQADPERIDVRNDFVIFRFRRQWDK